jgi:hypothetical protein
VLAGYAEVGAKSGHVTVTRIEAAWQRMRILVRRFIYQGLRCALSRQAVRNQLICGPPQAQDEKGSLSLSADRDVASQIRLN